jgi:type II secretory pathway pseudopilin PulG
MNTLSKSQIRPRGFTLLDVVLAIAIFAFGMLALIQLQGGLTRSHSDANYRTVAVSLAEELIETYRGFSQPFASDNGRVDYAEIVSSDAPELHPYAGTNYYVERTVTDYYHVPDPLNPDATPFSTEKPVGVVLSDFKVVELRVTWSPIGQLEALGSDELLVREIIPSTPSLIGANIVADDDGEPGTPPVDFTPGERPDIVSLSLGEGTDKFKESTKPQPDVDRGAFQTWFDVVTYSQGDLGAVFLRREEFLAVKCDCELFSSNAGGGLRPTLWAGYEYTEGEFVNKYYGERATGTPDDLYCDICCRDHHDGGSTDPEHVYDPFGGGSGDHPHYGRDNQGNIIPTPVQPNQGRDSEYVEACRLVRKDGFMRVTHDAFQQTLNGFQEGYLSFTENVDAYSDYVTSAVTAHYESDQASFDQPEDVSYVIPASTPATATDLPTVYYAHSQQLRSRAVYTDYLTREAQDNLNACFDNLGNPTPDNLGCNIPNASSPLEVYPFFELQMTWLDRWNEKPVGDPVDVTNDKIQSGNTHSRGLAYCGDRKNPSCIGGGQVDVIITSHNGNLGLTATGAIDPDYESDLNERLLYVDVNLDNTPQPDVGKVVAGSLTSGVRGVDAADLVLTPDNALCGQTDVDYSCLVSTGGGTLKVSDYYKNRTALWVCSDGLVTVGSTPSADPVGGTSSVTFALPASNLTADIWIANDPSCPR